MNIDTDENLINKQIKIINEYGIYNQLKYMQSEIFEFNEAVLNYERDNINNILNKDYKNKEKILKQHIIEEMSDVLVMLHQIQLYYNITDEQIKEIMEFKINRQIKRIKGDNRG